MEIAYSTEPCPYCGIPIGRLWPYSGEGVMVWKGKKLIGIAHRACDERQTKKAKMRAKP